MNKRILAIIAAGFFALAILVGNAEELVGQVVATSSQAVSSVAPNMPMPPIDPVPQFVKDEVQKNIPSFGAKFANDNFNEMVLIPIVAIIVVFGGSFTFILVLVGMRHRAKAQQRLQRQEQIQRFIDAGRDVPNELLRDSDSFADDEANLSKGVKHTLVGLALVVFLTVLIGFEIGAVGLIIVAVGLSRLVIWKLSQSKKSAN